MCECGSLPKLAQMKQDFFVAQMKSILVGPKDDSKNQKVFVSQGCTPKC
jgi:hypothetical protein